MKSKILEILIPLLLVLSLIIGLTMAYFSDIEKSENNIFSAGTLDLKTDDKDGVEAIWKGENMMPGDEVEGEIEFKNAGSISIESLIMEVEIE